MGVLNGKYLIVLIRNSEGTYYPIACDRTCTISITRESMQVCNPVSVFDKFLPGPSVNVKVSGDGLVNFNRQISASTLQQALIAGTLLRMMFEIGGVVYEFEGYVNNVDMTGANKAALSFTYAFTVSGDLLIDDQAIKEDETGVQNLLLISPGGELLDIDNSDNNLIL